MQSLRWGGCDGEIHSLECSAHKPSVENEPMSVRKLDERSEEKGIRDWIWRKGRAMVCRG